MRAADKRLERTSQDHPVRPPVRFHEIVRFYLASPAIWPELRRQMLLRLKWRFGHALPDPKARAEARRVGQAWCQDQALDAEQALDRLGVNAPLLDPRQCFPAEFDAADRRVAEVPMKLGGAGNLSLLYTLCEGFQARRVLETGVAYGWSSLAVLLSLRNRRGARLYSVDLPYLAFQNDRWVGAAVPDDLRCLWKLYRMADREGLPKALKAAGCIDLAHYDSDKSPAGRRFAYGLIWRALRPSGLLVSDDVGDNLAFRDFCISVEVPPIIVTQAGKYQGIVVKPRDEFDRRLVL